MSIVNNFKHFKILDCRIINRIEMFILEMCFSLDLDPGGGTRDKSLMLIKHKLISMDRLLNLEWSEMI